MSQESPRRLSPATLALHAGRSWSPERENSPALYLTSSYVFENAAQAQAVFAEKEAGNIYSRFTNPSVGQFEERLAAMEGGERALGTASGMSAITTLFLSLLSAGDHVAVSRSVFGSTTNIVNTILPRFGIQTSRLPLADPQAWREAIRPNTRLMFVETPANPTLELGDLAALAEIAREHGVLLAVDNVFCTPYLQRPLEFGAHLVVHSATKFIDGQGRVLGGAIVGERKLLSEKIFPFIRNTGPTLSAFNAWVLLKGLETLPTRMERHCDNADKIAHALNESPELRGKVAFPGLPDHPQHALAARQMRRFGSILCLELESRERAHAFMDRLQLATITANLGDSRTLVTHPATTTHSRISAQDRQEAGVTEGLVRFSIGLEEADDILDDIRQALAAAS
ncbi:MAG: O-succinylhomoserine sulfhydrylase [Magnetococcales bacterium]|nr:O-succinylhomoserine sulfhydrylase [Magnetococcales bacterium]